MNKSTNRKAKISRETSESNISVSINLDGTGKSSIDTPLGFFKHMLNQISSHGLIDLDISANGDLETGTHHTIEDTAIALGRAIDSALGDRKGIIRMSNKICPLDESLSQAVIDLSGRGYSVVDMMLPNNIGEFPTDMVRHFFETLAVEGRFCLHLSVLKGENEHHIIESAFKAFARALREASTIDPRSPNVVPSSKGTLTS